MFAPEFPLTAVLYCAGSPEVFCNNPVAFDSSRLNSSTQAGSIYGKINRKLILGSSATTAHSNRSEIGTAKSLTNSGENRRNRVMQKTSLPLTRSTGRLRRCG